MSLIRNSTDLANLRYSCRILMSCHHHLKTLLVPGTKASEIDAFCEQFGAKYGATPAFKTKKGYRHTITFSVDHEITHAIPTARRVVPLNGLLKIDAGFVYHGMVSDAAQTYILGDISPEDVLLSQRTEEAMRAGIAAVKAGCTVGDIGAAVDAVARKYGYGNVRELGGHGLGYSLHDTPFVPHYGNAGKGAKLFENKVITIEPMFNIGGAAMYIDEKDGWTIRTQDGSHSAQWEADVLVTKTGCEVLTDIAPDQILPL
jgi:methionyl aminopeptidase